MTDTADVKTEVNITEDKAAVVKDDQGTFKEDVVKQEDTTKVEGTTDDTPPPDDKPDEDAALDADVWGSTGDDVGDSVLQLLQNSGTTPETAKALLWDAVKAGDATKIDRDALVEAVGKTKANLIMAGMENYVGKIAARTAEVTKVVNDEVGGKENWEAIRDWAKTALSDDDMADYADMIDKGGRKAALAARDLREQYEATGKTLKEPTKGVTPSGKTSAPAVEPLSRADYYTKVEALHKKGEATPDALNQLWKARERGIASGK